VVVDLLLNDLLWANDYWLVVVRIDRGDYDMPHISLAGLRSQRQPVEIRSLWVLGQERLLLSLETSCSWTVMVINAALGMVQEQVVFGVIQNGGGPCKLACAYDLIGASDDLLLVVVYYILVLLQGSIAWRELGLRCWGLSDERPA